LTRIFNGEREYLFTTRRNVRSFEWTTAEIEDLFESILCLEEQDELELNAITILPSSMSDEQQLQIGRTSQIYDVHDGQQRLVSLCLLLAALRDNLLLWGDKYDDDAREVSRAIYPVKSRWQAVNRIYLRDKNSYLNLILSKKDVDGKIAKKLQFPTPRHRKHLPPSDRLIVEAYEYFCKRIEEMGPRQALEVLLENFMSKVYLLVCIPANTRIARNIVMGMGKGKNLEPVDEFKGMVCFNSIKDESRQDEVLEQWNSLCEQVGRHNVESACVLFAQIFMRKPVQRNGEVDLMEVFLKKYMEDNADNQCDGKYIFEEKIVPVSRTLQDFRDGHIALVVGKSVEEWPSLRFLLSACTIATAKEVELTVLFLLIHWQSSVDTTEKLKIQQQLRQLEGIALWMMVAKPKRAERLKRCFEIMERCSTNEEVRNQTRCPLELTKEERAKVLDTLHENEFGSSPSGSKVARILLDRLNEFELVQSHQGHINPIEATLQLEHILPQKYQKEWGNSWDATIADEWMHRLGNLALLNQKANAMISNGPFSKKKKHLEASPYPLTKRIAKSQTWDLDAVQQHHNTILRLSSSVWDLRRRSPNEEKANRKKRAS
jgi:hypothetical protein